MHYFHNLQIFDLQTGYVISELYIEKVDNEKMPLFLIEAIEILKYQEFIEINRQRCADSGLFKTEIEKWPDLPLRLIRESSKVPYRVHGGREFDLMSKGIKPLAIFRNVTINSSLSNFIEKYFVKTSFYVEIFDDDPDFKSSGSDYMISRSNEMWRIGVYKNLIRASRLSGWNDSLEYMEGYLLGYNKDEQLAWTEMLRSAGNRWGLHAFYASINEEEVNFIKKSGSKVINIQNIKEHTLYLPIMHDTMILRKFEYTTFFDDFVAVFYIPLYKIIEYKIESTGDSFGKFDIFVIPEDEQVLLNTIIDGKISIINSLHD